MEEKKAKLVFNAGVARNLLKMGCHIADIKPDRVNPDRSLFIFERTAEFEKAFTEINTALKNKSAE